MRLVLDASAAINSVIPGHLREVTLQRLEGAEPFAPGLIDTEVLSGLARLERAGALSAAESDYAVAAWQRMPCTRVPVERLLPEIWALRQHVRVTDAHYVVLARALRAPLLTADLRLARATLPGLSVLTIA